MARWIDEWIVDSFAEPLIIDDIELRTSVKVGIAVYPADADTAESLFVNAEAALKRAKDAADPYLFYSPEMNARVAQRLRLESRLRKAVAQKEFVLHYQTKVDLATRRIRGLEALIRWNDPEFGLVSPLEFVPLLEESGLIVEVGRWVFEQAVADTARWRSLGPARCRAWPSTSRKYSCGIPISSRRCWERWDPSLSHATGIDVEITETMIAQNTGANVQKLLRLREAGLQIFMDDFGTGYSGLSQIAHLPLGRPQDRPRLRRRHDHQRRAHGHRLDHHQSREGVAHLRGRRGSRNRRAGRPAVRTRLRRSAGLSLQPSVAGRGHRQLLPWAVSYRLTLSIDRVRLAASLACRFAQDVTGATATISEPQKYPGDSTG